MRFVDFLKEAVSDGNYKTVVDKDDIVELFNKQCSKATGVLYRGMRGESDAFILEGNKSTRKSVDGRNYYTILIDHFSKPGLPKRSKSIICTQKYRYAQSFGSSVYVIIPFDDVIIGNVNDQDIWNVQTKLGRGVKNALSDLNNRFSAANIDDTNYADLVSTTEKFIRTYVHSSNYNNEALLYNSFDGDAGNVEEYLEDAYNTDALGFDFITSDQLTEGGSECYISGKCLAIRVGLYEELIENGDIKLA